MKVALLLALASCVDTAPLFHCNPGDDAACVRSDGTPGTCAPTGNCAFPDPTCGAQGLRYDASAMPGRGGVCILSPDGASTTGLAPIDANHFLGFEMTTAPQPIVFDTEVNGTNKLVTLHWFASPCPPTSTQEPAMTATCGNPLVARISVSADVPGTYCLVASDDNPTPGDEIALRVFPNTSPPACTQ